MAIKIIIFRYFYGFGYTQIYARIMVQIGPTFSLYFKLSSIFPSRIWYDRNCLGNFPWTLVVLPTWVYHVYKGQLQSVAAKDLPQLDTQNNCWAWKLVPSMFPLQTREYYWSQRHAPSMFDELIKIFPGQDSEEKQGGKPGA